MRSARLIFNLRRYDSVADALASLHWLRVPQRVQFKVAVLTYKTLHGTGPQYLGPLVRVADLPGRQSLRSAGTNRLVVPPVRLATVGSRAFAAAGPRVWNSLPSHVTGSGVAGDISRTAQNALVWAVLSLCLIACLYAR